MKQQKLSGYQPNYPKKAIRGMTLAAAALVAIGATTGCRMIKPETTGLVPLEVPVIEETVPPDELQTEGYVTYEETPEPPMTTGLPAITPTPEALELMGDVAIIDDMP